MTTSPRPAELGSEGRRFRRNQVLHPPPDHRVPGQRRSSKELIPDDRTDGHKARWQKAATQEQGQEEHEREDRKEIKEQEGHTGRGQRRDLRS